jgi:hypothetical protein
LERGPIEMRIESRQRSVLDKRYLSDLERGVPETDNLQVRYSKPAEESAGLDFQGLSEAKFSSFVKGAVSSPKVEPDF